MTAALVVSLALRYFGIFDASTPIGFAKTILTTVAITTLVWVVATFATSPEPIEKLAAFYRRVHPAGRGWRIVAQAAGIPERSGEILPNILNWILGIGLVYSTLFGIGEMIFGAWGKAALFIGGAVVCGFVLAWNLNETNWAGLEEAPGPETKAVSAD
jgi:hypothetical protein